MQLFSTLKKIAVILFAGFAITLVNFNNARADSSLWDMYLQAIADNTGKILLKVNDLPTDLQNLIQLIGTLKINLISTDDTDHTATMQQQFSLLGNLIAQSSQSANIDQTQMTANLLNVPLENIAPKNGGTPKVLEILPNINDLTYSTVLGKPVVPKAASNPVNYINNVSGINLVHDIPNSTWQGSDTQRLRYWHYFNTVSAIESFSGYMLTKQMSGNDSNLTATQMALVQEASDSNWLASIATEEIGKVLRQILIFNSQTYVLLTSFAKAQQDLLTAQIMTNTLLISNNVQYESMMKSDAQGVRPKA